MPALGFIPVKSQQAVRTAKRHPKTFPRLSRNAYVRIPASICYRCGLVTGRTIVNVRGYVDVAAHQLKVRNTRDFTRRYNEWLWREEGKGEDEDEYDLFDLFDLRYLFGDEEVEEGEIERDWEFDMYLKTIVNWIDKIYNRE
ncbi:uncharacterized protein LOC118648326 [Monomorium pharaonis]|uniref:uncharacterized protein LOC118648326 n=1 Tax=Monomorium pharaonis TaxID=307658 RepID=UPI00174739A2|nr:uncharacterized protein LOC118648326 [Monomorium pharaonis]